MVDCHTVESGRVEFEKIMRECGWQNVAEWFIDQSSVPQASVEQKNVASRIARAMDKFFGGRC